MTPAPVKFQNRIGAAMQWRLAALKSAGRDRIYNLLGSWGSGALIHLRWPWPLRKPYQRHRLRLRPPGVGIGDNLMCTPIFREIKRQNPNCHITFLTRHPDLFTGNPHIDQIICDTSAPVAGSFIRLGYDHLTPNFRANRLLAKGWAAYQAKAGSNLYYGYAHPHPPPRPLISIMAECVGLEFYDDKLDCALPTVSPEFQAKVAALGPSYLVIQPRASDWTPNKDWPVSDWQDFVQLLVQDSAVVEVGTRSLIDPGFQHPRFHRLAGQTSLREFIYLVSKAKLFVGPVSGGMHIANAFGLPAIILYGGWESPAGLRYPNVVPFYSPVPCAPCWLTTPCPFQTKCLTMIRPQQVLAAVRQTLIAGPGAPA